MESIQRSRLENSKAMSRMRTELACEERRYLKNREEEEPVKEGSTQENVL